jgi:hypothetical protein
MVLVNPAEPGGAVVYLSPPTRVRAQADGTLPDAVEVTKARRHFLENLGHSLGSAPVGGVTTGANGCRPEAAAEQAYSERVHFFTRDGWIVRLRRKASPAFMSPGQAPGPSSPPGGAVLFGD